MINIEFVKLDARAVVPSYSHPHDAGADLTAIEDVSIAPGQRILARTGISIAIPAGFVGLIHPRSGLATKHGVTVVNAPGTIDSGYRGEIKIALINLDPHEVVQLSAGTRIAQLVIQRVETAAFVQTDSLDDTSRGVDGFGSTGMTHG